MIDGGRILCYEDTDRLLSDYAVLKVSEKYYESLDKSYILRIPVILLAAAGAAVILVAVGYLLGVHWMEQKEF